MQEIIAQVREKQAQARLSRNKGDALRKANREQEARIAYEAGVFQLSESAQSLSDFRSQLEALAPPLSSDLTEAVGELAEVCGALGGLYQRLGLLDKALASYTEGAGLEERFELPETYNRLNAIKYTLLTGAQRLSDLTPKIRALADMIDSNIRSHASLGDSGWALADLADCLALLGRTDEAAQTYAKFVAKAETKSPERALEVLVEIASKLRASGDPEAARVETVIDILKANIVRR